MDSEPVPSPEAIRLPLIQALTESWYYDHTDPRCPHDAWLRSVSLTIDGRSQDEGECVRVLRLELLGAYHNGVITLSYRGLLMYQVILRSHEEPEKISRREDWLEDSVEVVGNRIRHVISWETGQWILEAEEITFAWAPKDSDF